MSTPSIDQETLINVLEAQCKSADFWCDEYEKHKDGSSIRNAALSIGKVSGIYSVLILTIQDEGSLPKQITEIMNKYNAVWERISLQENN